MSLFIHFDDDEIDYESLRDNYISDVDTDAMASLNEIKRVHEDDDYLTAKEFCKKHNLI